MNAFNPIGLLKAGFEFLAAMRFGGGAPSNTSSTQTTEPWAPLQPHLRRMLAQTEDVFSGDPSRLPGWGMPHFRPKTNPLLVKDRRSLLRSTTEAFGSGDREGLEQAVKAAWPDATTRDGALGALNKFWGKQGGQAAFKQYIRGNFATKDRGGMPLSGARFGNVTTKPGDYI